MAFENENGSNGFYMPVAPAYMNGGNGGFGGWGGDGLWLILLFILLGNGGWGNGFGGFGGAMGYDFPWLMTGQQNINTNTNNGFRDAMINDGITSIRDGISGLSTQMCNGFGNVQTSLCNGFAGVNATINGAQNAIAQQLYTNQIADMQQAFAAQTQMADCCCKTQTGIQDLKYTVATENCADRTAAYQNTRDIIDAQTRGTQAILDKLCALELDGYKRENDQLRSQLQFANMQASQVDQTAQLRTSQATVANQLVSELRSCPIPSQPVYGNQPIFTCGGNTVGCGCGAVA